MATLILTAVGTAIGGPIGGALGAIAGQAVDQRLFAPKARHGPRLGDLSVQTSSYGTQIPRLYGTMRVAGTVIWATDLVETRSTTSLGKGQPKTVNYSYSASFAVALSGRQIRGVRRIWADGRLLRGAAGDFKSATGYRLYRGDEDQAVDPLIASAEGAGQAPAFRGLAYALFEDFQLEDYGNRIPSLTFEVEADDGPVPIGDIAADLSAGLVTGAATPAPVGYAASGDSVRAAIAALADVVPMSLADDGAALRLTMAEGGTVMLAAAEETERRSIVRRALDSVPDEIGITYYDPARDYQAGLQRAAAEGGPGRNAERLSLPAAFSAGAAKGLAEYRLAMLRAGRASVKAAYDWRRADLRPGALARIEGLGGAWKVSRWTLGAMRTSIELTGVPGGSPVAADADAGRPASADDLIQGPTTLRLRDLPLGNPASGTPMLFAFAAGDDAGWRRADLIATFDDGASWLPVGRAGPATMGAALTALAARPSTLFDTESALEVELLSEAMWLESASDAALAGGANLALIGEELIQFGRAEWIAPRQFRLSRLLRGRRGTEWAAASHAPGEDFALVAADGPVAIAAPEGSIGGIALVSARGIGDPEDVVVEAAIDGAALRPPPPVHLMAERQGDGGIALRWTRRSREGWRWQSDADTPLGEQDEVYRLDISGEGFARQVTLSEPAFLYSAGDQASDGAAGPIAVSVVQIGTYAPSRPATIIVD